MRELPDESVNAVVTDPPYGMNFLSQRSPKDKQKRRLSGDDKPFIWFLHDAFRVTAEGGCLVCFTDWKNQETWRVAIECAGWTVKSHCIWDRVIHGMGDLKGSFAPLHDVFWFAVKGAGFEFPDKRPKSVLRHQRVGPSETPHPTAKPVPLMSDIVAAVSRPGDVILDPFMGTGSTGVAALELGRSFYGIELDSEYYRFACGQLQSRGVMV